MKKTSVVSVVALALALAGGVVGNGPLFGVAPATAAPQVSPKVGVPLKEAQGMIQSRNFKGALAKLDEIKSISGKSAYESSLVAQLEISALLGAGQHANAAKAIEALLASGQVPANQKDTRYKQLMRAYADSGNQAKVIEVGNRYLKEVGPDDDIQMSLAQSYTQQKNFKAAEEMVRAAIRQAEARGKGPTENQLATLRYVAHERGDTKAEQQALEQLVQRYPDAKKWEDLLLMAEKNLRNEKQAGLDIARIRFQTGGLKTPEDYMTMAQDALQQNFPQEAERVMQAGIQKNVLGQGQQRDRHMRLLDMAKKQSADMAAALPAREAAAKAAATGDEDVKLGQTYTAMGQSDKAVEAIQRGIKKGVTDKDLAQLRLGQAYLAGGKRAQADAAFKAIKTPNTYASQMGRLWSLYAANAKS